MFWELLRANWHCPNPLFILSPVVNSMYVNIWSITGYWIEARKGDTDNKNLIDSLLETCRNKQLLWQNYLIGSTSLYISTRLEQNFTDKEKELEGLLKEKPSQMFAYGLVHTKAHADEIVEQGRFFRHILHVPLGDPNKGVNVIKHADVLMTYAAKKRIERPWLIVYRVSWYRVGSACTKTWTRSNKLRLGIIL